MIDNPSQKRCSTTANRNTRDNNKWRTPIGGGFGNQPINTRVAADTGIEKPYGKLDWQMLFPKQTEEESL